MGTPRERPSTKDRDQEIKRIRDNVAALDYQYDKGKEEGIKQTAINMLKQDLAVKHYT